jgi:UDP-glucose 4-epimerase
MIKSIVSGGAGFIGSHLADKLIELGHDVVIIDDLSTGSQENIPAGATFVHMSLGVPANNELLDTVLQDADYVFHLAANPQIAAGLADPLSTHCQTVDGTVQLLDRIRKMPKMPILILTSSCAVYGNADDCEYIPESHEIQLSTPYALQKYSQELYAKLFCQLWKIPTVILRYFNVYGTKRQSESGAYPNVIASFAKCMRETGKIWITGDGEQCRDYVHVFDVVDANIAAMNSNIHNAEILNIGTGKTISINDIAKHFDCPREYIAERPGDIKRACANLEYTKKILNWEATISFEEGIYIYFNS